MQGPFYKFLSSIVSIWILLASAINAQDTATLLADQIQIDPGGQIVAEGNVVVFYQDTRLTATRIIYDKSGDQLSIDGPIVVTSPDGNEFSAESATLDRTLQNGILISARLVLDRQLQLAAAEVARVGNRYTTLSRTVASSCEVCAENPTPLWEIRANRVIHDSLERQLYFENATLRVVGVPIFYIPRLRLPDPTLERTSGFLIPRLQTSSTLGTGLKVPYFFAAGPHVDLTVTPYVSASTATLEFGYRQEVKNGKITADGAITNDDIEGGRGYLFANAEYRLPRGFLAKGQLEFVSDPGYLFLYDYSEKDRLTNALKVSRVRDKDFFRSGITEFRTLRENEIPIRRTLPDRFIEATYERIIDPLSFGGRTTLSLEAAALNRPSSTDVDGRDVSRLGIGLTWRDDVVFGPGIVTSAELGARLDTYNIGQDSNFDTTVSRLVPRGAVELRWPLARHDDSGTSDIVEPIVRIDFADAGSEQVPLEDSRIVEFDEANLFSYSRYPGIDGVEDGARVAAGLMWHRQYASGWSLDLAAGRVASLDGSLGFADGTGLTGDQSEWLFAVRFGLGDQFWLANRSLFDDNVAFTLSETRFDWQADRGQIGTSYIFAEPEPAENRNDRLSEWSLDGSLNINDNWTASTDWRYDFTAGRAARAGLGLEFTNECVRVDLSLSRRFATSTSVTPTTDFGFRVSLLGVGNGTNGRAPRRSCKG